MTTLFTNSPASYSWQWFSTLWALAFVFHYDHKATLSPTHVIVLSAGAIVAIARGRPTPFILFLIGSTFLVVGDLPAASNHSLLALIVNSCLLACALVAKRCKFLEQPYDATRSFTERWALVSRAPVALTILAVYFFGAFHKLNSAFLWSDSSCAGVLVSQMAALQGVDLGPLPEAAKRLAAIATVGVEAALLFLFAIPKWRGVGFVVGAVFHFGLAWAHFYDFSTYMFAVFILLVPVSPEPDNRGRRLLTAIAGSFCYILFTWHSWSSDEVASPIGLRWYSLQMLAWCMVVAPAMMPIFRSLVSSEACHVEWSWSTKARWLLVFPLVAFLNGCTPYLGLKTVANYSMFSNLNVAAGSTNHLFSGSAAQLTPWLSDTVQVYQFGTESAPALQWDSLPLRIRRQARWLGERPPVRVPWIELRRVIELARDQGIVKLQLRYERNGVLKQVEDATTDSDFLAPLPWWNRWITAFRAIQRPNRPEICRW